MIYDVVELVEHWDYNFLAKQLSLFMSKLRTINSLEVHSLSHKYYNAALILNSASLYIRQCKTL